jgi:hypothetical protein
VTDVISIVHVLAIRHAIASRHVYVITCVIRKRHVLVKADIAVAADVGATIHVQLTGAMLVITLAMYHVILAIALNIVSAEHVIVAVDLTHVHIAITDRTIQRSVRHLDQITARNMIRHLLVDILHRVHTRNHVPINHLVTTIHVTLMDGVVLIMVERVQEM